MVTGEQVTDPHQPSSVDGPRVLVVDDEETVMLTMQGILELDGYNVTSTTDGGKALELLRSQRFDVVLTDLRLSDGVDGLDVVRELKRLSPDGVAVMLTGYASLDSAVNAMREGAYDYLIKPCDVVELRMTIRRSVERSQLAGQIRQHVDELEEANARIRAINLALEERVEQATAALRRQIVARDEFMATVSHDLKTPLTFIKGLSALRRRRAIHTAQTETLIDALHQIEACAGRMAQQLDELVDASRLESGRPLELRREPMDLIAIATKAAAEHQQMSDRHAIRVTSRLDTLVGQWDEPRLGRVIDNLLDNAVKYSPRGGAIELAITLEGDDAVLVISDAGEGIPADDLPHIFERFRRGENVEGRIPGTGIGLSGVQQILEQHHGSISVKSEIGKGTEVTIRLPLNPPAL